MNDRNLMKDKFKVLGHSDFSFLFEVLEIEPRPRQVLYHLSYTSQPILNVCKTRSYKALFIQKMYYCSCQNIGLNDCLTFLFRLHWSLNSRFCAS
jgi:hypothetical protein